MQILRIIPTIDPDVGGPSNSAVNAAIAEARLGAETTLIFTGDGNSAVATGPARARLDAAGVKTLMFPRPRCFARQAGLWGVSVPMFVWMLRNVRRFDVVHLHYVWTLSTVVGALLGRAVRRQVVLTAHESLTRYDIDTASGSSVKRRAKLALRALILGRVNSIVCASRLEMADSVRADESGVVISHPVVDQPRTHPLDRPIADDFVLGYLGRLHPKKNIELLLTALSRLPEHRLILCGDGSAPYRERLHEMARRLGAEERVEWRGHVNMAGRDALFADSDVLVMPSFYECFGMAGAEALAAGLPVVASSKTGIADLIEMYDAGAVVPTNDENALVETLCELARRHSLADLRENALKASTENLTFDAYGTAVIELYASLLSGERTALSSAHTSVGQPLAHGSPN